MSMVCTDLADGYFVLMGLFDIAIYSIIAVVFYKFGLVKGRGKK